MTPNDTPSWGIEPVPERLRVLGTLDGLLLWSNLSVSLLVIVAGAFLVLPADQFGLALSLPVALGAIVAAAVVGNLLLGLGGLIGADARVPTMVLLRAPLGRRGSYLPTALNIVQCLGWSVFELIIIATGASALSEQLLRLRRRAVLEDRLRLRRDRARAARPGRLRPQVRAQVRDLGRDRVARLPRLVVAARPPSRRALASRRLARVLARLRPRARVDHQLDTARRRLHPLLAHAARRLRRRRARLLPADVPLFALGAVIALSRHISDAPGLLTAVAAGGAASLLALLALTVDESDEAFANVYSGAVSLQNLMPRVPQRILVGGVAAIATVGALVIDLRNYQPFLYLLGSFFVPLFAVLLADWLLAGRHYGRDDVFRVPEIRLEMVVAWLTGFCVYQWLYPQGPSWWTGLVAHTQPARAAVGRSVAAELPGRIRARRPRTRALEEAHTGERVIALIGNLSLDVLPGAAPRIGGGSYHGARALQRLRVPARVVARCAAERPRQRCCRRSSGSGRPSASSPASRPPPSRSPTTATAARCASTRSAIPGAPTDIPASPLDALGARGAARPPRVPGRDAGGARAPLPRLL